MLTASIALLGAFAGLTIFLGLPLARLQVAPRIKGALNAFAVGILLFLLVEVVEHGWGPVEDSVAAAVAGGSWGSAALFAGVFVAGLLLGLLSLVWFEGRYLRGARDEPEPAAGSLPPTPAGPGVADATPRASTDVAAGPGTSQLLESRPRSAGRTPGVQQVTAQMAPRLAMMIAVGIGLHNFSEGLAIGASAASGALSFALVLGIGFALHNATEGFGVAAPLTGTKPSWRFLGTAGLVAGGPTFVGTLIGAQFTSEVLNVLFLSLAAGSLFYVIKELLQHGRRLGEGRDALPMMAAVAGGLLLGLATDLVVSLGGA
ncbi:MAG: ZIP family metal transporter [Halobacteriales archaeon]|nr:ZIP family metal transporter [Halobacteriales archaeon]